MTAKRRHCAWPFAIILLVACNSETSPASDSSAAPSIDVHSLQPTALDMPATYWRFDEGTGSPRSTELNWTAVETADPIPSDCGTEVGWVWSDVAEGDTFGDPTMRLYVCAATSVTEADRYLETFAIEDSVAPQIHVFEPIAVDLPDPLLHADPASVACVWGEPDMCRAWAFVGQYGQHIAKAHWIAAGGGALDESVFAQLVTSIDAFMDDAISS